MNGFPKGFRFGWSQSAFQSEMGNRLNVDSNTDWYKWVHDSSNIVAGRVSGDFPEDGPGYLEHFKDFHREAAFLGLDIARLSIEWSRLFPTGPLPKPVCRTDGDDILSIEIGKEQLQKLDMFVDKNALRRYTEIFRDLRSHDISLILNLYHWSLPIWLHDPLKVRDIGPEATPSGWLSKDIAGQFALYAAYAASKFDDFVLSYSTMNEPNVLYPKFPPGYFGGDISRRVEANLIEAHARAYDAIKSVSEKPVGIISGAPSYVPEKPEDQTAAQQACEERRWPFFDAVKFGRKGSIFRSDLKGRLDWIGLNYYTRCVVHKTNTGFSESDGYGRRCTKNSKSKAGLPTSDFGWEIYPEGLSEVLKSFWNRYSLPLWVSENGVADEKDNLRSYFIVSHLAQVLKSLEEGVDIRGYLHWTLVDNYEWADGFTMKFGLSSFNSKTCQLQRRQSSLVLKDIALAKDIGGRVEGFLNVPEKLVDE